MKPIVAVLIHALAPELIEEMRKLKKDIVCRPFPNEDIIMSHVTRTFYPASQKSCYDLTQLLKKEIATLQIKQQTPINN